jgi:putative glutamine amidotransferase
VTFIVASAALFLTPVSAFSQSIRLFTYQPHSGIPPLVIPVKNGESPIRATKRYLNGVKDESQLRELLERDPMPQMKTQGARWQLLEDGDFANRVLLVANRPSDYRARNWRVKTFTDPMAATGTNAYMVPFVGDIGLTAQESNDYINELNRRFPAFIGMGGDDVDWRVFRIPIGESKFYNFFRDAFEIKLYMAKIKTIREKEKLYLPPNVTGPRVDKLFVICRAFQIVAALTGHGINTHINGHGHLSDSGDNGKVSVFMRTDYELHALKVKTGSVMADLTNGWKSVNGVTSHHQCAVENPNGFTQITAYAPDGCPEALQSPDGNIIGIQGHFEIQAALKLGADTELAKAIMNRVMFLLTSMRPPMNECEQVWQTGS